MHNQRKKLSNNSNPILFPNKKLNELDKKYQSVRPKELRYFNMLRDLENENLSDFSMFETKKRNQQLPCNQCSEVCIGIVNLASHKESHIV